MLYEPPCSQTVPVLGLSTWMDEALSLAWSDAPGVGANSIPASCPPTASATKLTISSPEPITTARFAGENVHPAAAGSTR